MLSTCFPIAEQNYSSKDREFRKQNAYKIACPVIASLYRRGVLNPDPDGRIERMDLMNAIMVIGNSRTGSMFQAAGVVAYDENDPEQTISCSLRLQVGNDK